MRLRKGKVLESSTENGYRIIKIKTSRVSEYVATGPAGYESRPARGAVVIEAETEREMMLINGFMKALFELNEGEAVIYARQGDEVKSSMQAKLTGEIIINKGTNYAVKYNEAKTELDKLKTTVNDIITTLSSGATSATGGTVTFTVPPPAANGSDFEKIKAEKLRI